MVVRCDLMLVKSVIDEPDPVERVVYAQRIEEPETSES